MGRRTKKSGSSGQVLLMGQRETAQRGEPLKPCAARMPGTLVHAPDAPAAREAIAQSEVRRKRLR